MSWMPCSASQNSGELGETQTQIAEETSGGPTSSPRTGLQWYSPGRWGLVTQSSPELTASPESVVTTFSLLMRVCVCVCVCVCVRAHRSATSMVACSQGFPWALASGPPSTPDTFSCIRIRWTPSSWVSYAWQPCVPQGPDAAQLFCWKWLLGVGWEM